MQAAEVGGGQRQLTYTTDSQARIIGVVDAAGNGLVLSYGGIQVNRKAEVLLHEVASAPTTGWNEITLTTPVPYRWLQCVSAPNTYFNIAEIEFHKPVDPANPSAPTLLSGTVYGTDPAAGNSLSLRYPMAFDGITTTGFKYGRPSQGIAGIDLGAGNDSYVGKIRFMPRSGTNTPAMAAHIGLRFVAMIEQPEIIEVLQRVETTDGRAVNYLHDTHLDTSIGQNHLVFAGVDYDGDLLATSPGEARFTWTTAQQGTGPVIGIHNEPRSTRKEKQLKFEYVSPAVGTKGMIARVAHATTNETILANDPQSVRTLTTPGGRLTKMAYTSASPGNFAYVTSAAGHKTDFSWNAQRFLAKKTDAAGRATTFTWNAIGKRTGVTRPDGLVQTAAFDASGRVTGKTTTAAGLPTRTTGFTLDSVGKVTRTDYPDSSYQTFTYNSLGLVTQKRERDATLTTATYSATGLLLSVTTASGTSVAETTTHTYYGANDPSGSPARLRKSTTDPRGRTTSWEYDNRGLVTRTTFSDGSSRFFAYDSNGNKIMESDGLNERFWTYDDFNRVTTATDPLGGITQYFYGAGGTACACWNSSGPTRVVSPAGRQTFSEYDLDWRLVKQTEGHGTTAAAMTHYVYDAVGNVIQEIQPGGVTHVHTYDNRNRRIATTVDPSGLNLTTTRAFNRYGSVTSDTRPGGRTRSFTYDVMKRPLTATDEIGVTTSQAYDLAGRVISTTRAAGTGLTRTTTFGYDAQSRPVLTTYPDGTTTTASYHPGGALHTSTDELGRVRTYNDSLLAWQDSTGASFTSFVATALDPLGHTTTSFPMPSGYFSGVNRQLSAAGRVVESITDANGRNVLTRIAPGTADATTATATYDADGMVLTQTTDPGGLNETITFTYDARGNRLTSKDPLTRTTSFAYDLRGNLVTTTLPDTRQQTATYDALNRVKTQTDPKIQTLKYAYWNETGTPLTLKDATLEENTTTWTLSLRGQTLGKIYPNGDTHSYSYDALGRLATHTTPKNETCSYFYDLRDRLTLSDWNTATADTTRTYLANGLPESIDNGISLSEYAYDSCNQVTSETQTLTGQAARTVSYSYDADHLRLGMVHPSSRIVELAWNARAQLAAVTADGPPPFATYTYDKAGRPISITHENGVVETKSYNAAGELLGNLHTLGGSTLSGHSYTYDTTSRRTAESFADGTTPARIYDYDPASQVISATYGNGQADSYSYDPMGNRKAASLASQGGASFSYTANSVNQYTSISAQPAPMYDANGNLTQQKGNSYTWDSENRLLSVVPNTPATGAKSLQYRYDAHHRRVTRTIQEWTGSAWASTGTTHFIYDGWNVIEEYQITSSTSTLAKTYTWGLDLSGSLQGAGGVGALLMAEEVSGSTTLAYHFHYDGNGNVTEITDATGASAASYRYDAFGNVLIAAGPYAATNRYRFSTKPLDAEVVNAPLYYYGYRYYDPVTGRWPSRDPIEEEGGVNLYGFVYNDPLSWLDTLGESPYKGTKPVYNPDNWNDESTGGRYQYANNCYSYACDKRQDGNKTGPNKPQPGDESGFSPLDASKIDCAEIIKRAKGDGLKEAGSKGCCPKGYHKVHLVVDPGVDYHWYRQDQGGGWSHKPGWGEVQQEDASGNPITDPATADRDYSGSGGPNYRKHCGILCAPDF